MFICSDMREPDLKVIREKCSEAIFSTGSLTAYSVAVNLDGKIRTIAPNNQNLLGKWQDRAFALHKLTGQHG